MKTLFLIPFTALILMSCSEEKRLVQKASNAVDLYDYDKALSYYDQVLAKDSNSFYANAGKGVVLSEYMGRYDEAIPYLEKAQRKTSAKTSMKINNDLGKGYHYIGNYPRALYFYSKTKQYSNASKEKDLDPDYEILLSKRIADCRYAIEHPAVASPELQSYKNVGSVINTDKPEYGPVYTPGNLIFTSKRQDEPKEKKNGIDGRYFESMYVSAITKDGFSQPRRFTTPDRGNDSQFRKGGESAVSATSDGKTLYIYREGNLYEADLKDSTKREHKLPENINFSYLQGYAFVSADQKTLLFTSEAKDGRGGTDIYISVKDENGKWSDPKIMPYSINTIFNEDAPFMAEDGTLFFASNGLPGYGGYDIYKTRFKNGEWTAPENLGQPINTPGDDIYFILNPNSSKGFYSSNRPGGYGDMDIYYVNYKSGEMPECKPADDQFVIRAVADNANPLCYSFVLDMPEWYKTNMKSVAWKVNNEEVTTTNNSNMTYTFKSPDNCKIYAKVVANCDTCPSPVVRCVEKELIITQPIITYNIAEPAVDENNNNGSSQGQLDNGRMNLLGWNTSPAYFDYDKCDLREDAKAVLDQNIGVLKRNPDMNIVINGYTDSRGADAYNKALSARRVSCVKRYMVQHGVSQYRITGINAYGESMIENGCTEGVTCDEQQHALNRKVDFNVSNSNKLITSVFLH